MQHAHTLRRIGYLQTAPTCGDCAHSRPEPQGEFCGKFLFLTSEGARCAHWQPSDYFAPGAIESHTPLTDHWHRTNVLGALALVGVASFLVGLVTGLLK